MLSSSIAENTAIAGKLSISLRDASNWKATVKLWLALQAIAERFCNFRSLRNDNTKCLSQTDNITFHFRMLLSWNFPRKISFFWGGGVNFLSAPSAQPPQKRNCYYCCRFAVSEFWGVANLQGELDAISTVATDVTEGLRCGCTRKQTIRTELPKCNLLRQRWYGTMLFCTPLRVPSSCAACLHLSFLQCSLGLLPTDCARGVTHVQSQLMLSSKSS